MGASDHHRANDGVAAKQRQRPRFAAVRATLSCGCSSKSSRMRWCDGFALVIKAACASLLLSVFSGLAHAQVDADELPTPLEASNAETAGALVPGSVLELIQSLVADHPEVQAATASSAAAEQELKAAKLRRLPTPTVQVDGYSGGPEISASLFQPVFDFGYTSGAIRLASKRGDKALLLIEQARYNQTLRLLELLQLYLQNRRRAQIQRAALETLAGLDGLIARRINADVSPRNERILVLSRQAQAQSDLSVAEQAAEQARQQLSQMLGREVILDNWIVGDPLSEVSNLEDYLDYADREAIPILVALADKKIADAEARLAKSQRFPTIGIVAERTDSSSNGGGVDYRISGRISYSPGAGLSTFALANAANDRARAADYQVASIRRQVADAVVREFRTVTAANTRIGALESALSSANEVLDSYRRLFVAGKRSWLDVLNSARETSQAEMIVADVQTAAVIGAYKLRLVAGMRLWALEGGQ
jgi:outer membrane protein, adhesin transport system